MPSPLAFVCALLLACACGGSALAATDPATDPVADAGARFVPPQRGAPDRRAGGASRGLPAELPAVRLLAPPQGGQTASPWPTLYWFLAGVPAAAPSLEILEAGQGHALWSVALPRPRRAGLQTLELRSHGRPLLPGRQYTWRIRLVPEGAVPGAAIRYQPRPGGVPPVATGPLALAAEGYWYDALALAVQGFFEAERRQLLAQQGLDDLPVAR